MPRFSRRLPGICAARWFSWRLWARSHNVFTGMRAVWKLQASWPVRDIISADARRRNRIRLVAEPRTSRFSKNLPGVVVERGNCFRIAAEGLRADRSCHCGRRFGCLSGFGINGLQKVVDGEQETVVFVVGLSQ